MGKFGHSLALELAAAGACVLAVDNDQDNIKPIADQVTMAVIADVRNPQSMDDLGLSNFDAAIFAMTDNLSAMVTGIMYAKEAGIPLIIAKAKDDTEGRIYKKLGADQVIIPESEVAIRTAHRFLLKDYLDMTELSNDLRILEIPIRPEWIGKTLTQLELRKTLNINVFGVRETDGSLTINWNPSTPLPNGTMIIGEKIS